MKNPFGHIHVLIKFCWLDARSTQHPVSLSATTSDVDGATQNLDTSVPDLAVLDGRKEAKTSVPPSMPQHPKMAADWTAPMPSPRFSDRWNDQADASDANADATSMMPLLDQGEDAGRR